MSGKSRLGISWATQDVVGIEAHLGFQTSELIFTVSTDPAVGCHSKGCSTSGLFVY